MQQTFIITNKATCCIICLPSYHSIQCKFFSLKSAWILLEMATFGYVCSHLWLNCCTSLSDLSFCLVFKFCWHHQFCLMNHLMFGVYLDLQNPELHLPDWGHRHFNFQCDFCILLNCSFNMVNLSMRIICINSVNEHGQTEHENDIHKLNQWTPFYSVKYNMNYETV